MKPAFRTKPGKFGAKKPFYQDRPFGVKPLSYKAVCAECGAQCTVPFKPNGKKPILCSGCFKNEEGFAPNKKKPWEKQTDRPMDRQMHPASCSRCGTGTQVPFRPEPGRPIYCAKCLGHEDKTAASPKEMAQLQEQVKAMNTKIDEILAMLKAKA